MSATQFTGGLEIRFQLGPASCRLLPNANSLTLFDMPSLERVKEVMISQQVVEGTAGPLYMYAGGAREI